MERLVAKYSGAAAMYFVSKKLKKKHNISDERAALYEAAETWVEALKGRPFCGKLDWFISWSEAVRRMLQDFTFFSGGCLQQVV